jgi:hypothetical protein
MFVPLHSSAVLMNKYALAEFRKGISSEKEI